MEAVRHEKWFAFPSPICTSFLEKLPQSFPLVCCLGLALPISFHCADIVSLFLFLCSLGVHLRRDRTRHYRTKVSLVATAACWRQSQPNMLTLLAFSAYAVEVMVANILSATNWCFFAAVSKHDSLRNWDELQTRCTRRTFCSQRCSKPYPPL